MQNVLLGPGVTASGITYTGLPKMIASFTAPAVTNLGLNKGIYLTTGSNGNINTEQGPDGPSSVLQSVDQFQPGDASLDLLSTSSTYDASILEFDFIPQSDTVRFRYVFGSEEYNEFVNSSYNDVFAFILSGITTPLSPRNIALIPGTSTPITINNVNNGYSSGASTGPCSNCSNYLDNDGGTIDCVYDGLTIVLTAKHKVLCGQTYHIKIAIADAGDGILDSGVFLEAGSFSSAPLLNVYTINSNSNIPDSVLAEDCNRYCAYFVRSGNVSSIDSLILQVSGSALLGPDYIQSGNATFNWPTKLIFVANQDTIKFCNLIALQDNINEGTDTVTFTMTSYVASTSSCLSSNSMKFNLYIKDYLPISIGQNDISLCGGSSAILNASASFGYPAYTYTLSSPFTNTSILNTGPINTTTIFTITVNDICNKPVTKQIIVTPVATLTVLTTSTSICFGDSVSISVSGASTYSWSSGSTASSIIVSPTSTINYTVVGSVGSCTNSATVNVTVISQSISITGNNNICSGQSSILSAIGGSSYRWDMGATTSTISVTPTSNSTYTVTSSVSSCTNSAVYTVSVTPTPFANFTYASNTGMCFNSNNFSFTSTNVFQGPNGTLSWNFGPNSSIQTASTQVVSNISYNATGLYPVVLIANENGCADTTTKIIELYENPTVSLDPQVSVGCDPFKINFLNTSSAASNLVYKWVFSDGATSTEGNPTHVFTPAGIYNYTLTVSTNNKCMDTIQIVSVQSITVNPTPVASFTATPMVTTISDSDIFFFNTSVDNTIVNWYYNFDDGTSSNDVNPIHTYLTWGNYNVMQTVTNEFACSHSVNLLIRVLPEFRFWIPNAFTPGNKDNLNDVFKPIVYGVIKYTFMVFDRWGELLYTTTDTDSGWDGTYNNMPCTDDAYIWKCEFKNIITQQFESHIGHITLIR